VRVQAAALAAQRTRQFRRAKRGRGAVPSGGAKGRQLLPVAGPRRVRKLPCMARLGTSFALVSIVLDCLPVELVGGYKLIVAFIHYSNLIVLNGQLK
jgi:hypothetical protein